MKYTLFIIPALLLLSGCAGLSESMQRGVGVGVVKSNTSSFDGATEITMQPAFVASPEGGASKFKMGFNWRNSQPDYVGVLIKISSLSGYSTISGAAINIDGNITQLQPAEALTSYDSTALTKATCNGAAGCSSGLTIAESDKLFVAPLRVIQAIAAAKIAKVKVGIGRDYYVGDLHGDSYGNVDVSDNLPDFLTRIHTQITSK